MKIIFLDFDGVIAPLDRTRPEVYGKIWPDKVSLLNTIIDETGAKVVVSSAWRIGRTVEQLQAILDEHGFTGEVIGRTGTGQGGYRGLQIDKWMRDNVGVWQYIVIDDEISDMHAIDSSRIIHTATSVGLNHRCVDWAIRLLSDVSVYTIQD